MTPAEIKTAVQKLREAQDAIKSVRKLATGEEYIFVRAYTRLASNTLDDVIDCLSEESEK